MPRTCVLNADHTATMAKAYLGELITALGPERLAEVYGHWIGQPAADRWEHWEAVASAPRFARLPLGWVVLVGGCFEIPDRGSAVWLPVRPAQSGARGRLEREPWHSLEDRGVGDERTPRRIAVAAIQRSALCSRWPSAWPAASQSTRSRAHTSTSSGPV